MATIQLDYFGMTGFGATVKAAKADAGAKIERALKADYSPIIIEHRDVVFLVFRQPEGYAYKVIRDESGWRTDAFVANEGENREDAIRAASRHLAQWTWRAEDGTEAPAFVKDKRDRAEHRSWAEFQIRFAKARAAGLSDNEAHHYGGNALYMLANGAELLAKVEGAAQPGAVA